MNRLSALVLIAALCLTAAIASAAPPSPAISKEDLAALIAKVDASAKAWAEKDAEDQDLDAAFAKIQYDDASIPLLTTAIGAGKPDPQGLYVAVKLLDPIVVGRNDLILTQIVNLQKPAPWLTPDMMKKLLPAIKSADARMGKYLPMPNYPKETIAKLQIPPFSSGSISEATVKALEEINKLRAEKLAKEKPTVRHDELAWQLHRIQYRLMISLNDPREDLFILKAMADYELQQTSDFLYLVYLVEQAAPSMSADRAKKYYEEMSKMAVTLRWKWHGYANYGSIVLRPDGNSDPQAYTVCTGNELIKACNALAEKCNGPKLTPLPDADVRKVQPFVYKWREEHPTPPGGVPSDAEVQQYLSGQKGKPTKKGG